MYPYHFMQNSCNFKYVSNWIYLILSESLIFSIFTSNINMAIGSIFTLLELCIRWHPPLTAVSFNSVSDWQMELNKKRETELQRLKRDLEESSVQSEALAASLRKRHSDTVTELSEQCEALQRVRIKMEKEKQNLRMEVDELSASLETVQKARVSTQCPMSITGRFL